MRRTLAFGEGGIGWVALHRRPLNVPDVASDVRFIARAWFKQQGLMSFLVLPIMLDGTLLAVLALAGRRPFHFAPEIRASSKALRRRPRSLFAMRRCIPLAQDVGLPFALVLLDTTLPAGDSVLFAEQITVSPTLAGALIVMVSPAVQGTSLARWQDIKGATYVTKPLTPSELWMAIMTVLSPPAVMTRSTP